MILNKVALKRQSTVLLLLVLIVIIGVYCYLTLPRESFPDINIPYIFINTPYEGVAPSDIETLLTMPIERKLKGLNGVKEIRSTSAEGLSTVAVEFYPEEDIDDVLQKVRDKVEQAKPDLPTDLLIDPQITEVNFSDFPVMRVILSGPFSLRRLKTIADHFEDLFEAVPGVLDVTLSGGLDREIHVEFDLDRVAAYNVPFSSLIAAVQRGNVNMPGGSMDIGPSKYTIRTPEEFKDPSEIFSLVAFVRNGKPIYLRDLAFIRDSYADPQTRARINGEKSVTLAIQKRSGENILEISDEIRRIVEDTRPSLPPALKIDLTSDMADDVRLMISDLENNILSGLILILVVIFVFIGGRSAVIAALAIPYSMLLTFGLLIGFDITLNMVVLFGLMLALGMLVDNAIVIVENIYRHMQQGSSRQEAALIGVEQVAWPVITSTMTTLGAFLPLLFWQGIMGQFMKYIPITLIMALSSSLFVALVISPVLSARYQKIKNRKAEKSNPGRQPLIRRIYLRILRLALNHRLIVALISIILLLGSVISFGLFGNGVGFFPSTEPQRANVYIKAPVGTNLDASDKIVKQVEQIASEYEDARYVISNIGAVGGNPFARGGSGTHISRVVLDFKDFNERSRPATEIINELREKVIAKVKSAEIQVEGEEHGPPTGAAVNLEISGPDIAVLGELAARIRKLIQDVPGLVDLKDDFVESKPEIRVRVDKEKAALFGLDTYTIAYTIKAAINGVKVGTFRQENDEYPIMARLPERDRQSLESMKRITVSGPRGEPIPLTSVASISLASGYGAITRINQKRVVTVSGDSCGRSSNECIKEIRQRLADFKLPPGYSYKFTGEQQEQRDATSFLSKAFVAALFLIFIILVSQFNSIVTPLIVLTSVLLSLIGVFLGLVICRLPFMVTMTGIGIISLAGVVVNNAIVLIDYYNQLLARGLTSREALENAGLVRFRPVMLTAVTTILGLMPMATGVSFNFRRFAWEIGSESSQMWSHMAIAVIFGLTVATVLTLIVVPVLCSLAHSVQSRFKTQPES
ncbi:MAG: efflux RND transporter permease subunit [Deltaproteobacteria bacterium]|nr:efflux RND transporter permease subunit [Deltaproteobacteria bacterium]MBW2139884.1 efflux RND transporter permease subunit [Deltaproteobacteria bacterium]